MRTFIQLILSLLTFAVLIWAIWQGYLLLRTEQMALDAVIQPLVIIGAILILVCTFMLTSAISKGARTIAHSHQHQSKMELYETFLSLYLDFLDETNQEKQNEIEKNLKNLKIALALQSDEATIKAVNELFPVFNSEREITLSTHVAFEKLLVAMRQDLGKNNYYTIKKELKKMFASLK